MRILCVASGSAATVFAMAPLAVALRNDGHQVFMAANDVAVETVVRAGLPALAATEVPISQFISTGRDGRPVAVPDDDDSGRYFTGQWFARMAIAHRDALRDVTRAWRPEVVIGGTMSYAATLLAAELGVPVVRQAWDAIDATRAHDGAAVELAPELRSLGLDDLQGADLFVDVCPPALGPRHHARSTPMRWIPGNEQRPLAPWMYSRPAGTRVCLTAGSRATVDDDFGALTFLRGQVAVLREIADDLLVAAPEPVAQLLRGEFPGIRAGWMPLDVVATTCDTVVHNGGGTTTLTCLAAGVPQLILPMGVLPGDGAAAVAAAGAAITVPPASATIADIEKGCAALVEDPAYRQNARAVASQIAAMPTPGEVAREVARLAQSHAT